MIKTIGNERYKSRSDRPKNPDKEIVFFRVETVISKITKIKNIKRIYEKKV